MIYIPIEIQLSMIREALEDIKLSLADDFRAQQQPLCRDCEFAKSLGLAYMSCPRHAPEFNNFMAIHFPLEES